MGDQRKLALPDVGDRLAEIEAIAHVASVAVDLDAGTLVGSPELFHILGRPVPPDGRADFAWLDGVHEDDRDRLAAALREAGHAGGCRTSVRVLRPDGAERQVVVRLRPVGPRRLQGTFEDVTDRRSLARMQEEFVSIATHELRTPLTAILVPLQLLGSGLVEAGSPEGQSMLTLALESAERLGRLVEASRLYGRLERGAIAPKPAECDAVALLRTAARSVGGEVVVLPGPAELPLHADPDQVITVLEELLRNALAVTPKGGRVEVAAAPHGDEVWLTVRDHGPGVPVEHAQAIYEPYRQADASMTRALPGMGLGLALARRLARLHGGRVWHENLDDGCRFTLALPVEARPPA